MDIIFLIGRILYGGFFVVLGASYIKNADSLASLAKFKKVPLPKLAIYICSLISILAGLGIITGRHTMYALTAIIVVLLLTSFKLHDYWNSSDPHEIALEMSIFMRNMALIGASLMLYSVLLPWTYSF